MELVTTGVNAFLVDTAKLILSKGIERKTRGFSCFELPEPILIKITNPRSRIVTIDERKWNPFLPYVESLWIAKGLNSLEFPAHYVKKLLDFSDDGDYMRAGYGPRMRFYNGDRKDYRINNTFNIQDNFIDQLLFVVKELKRDKYSRRAVITIGDPNKDCFDEDGNMKFTKDFPCTRLLQFQVQPNDELDLMTTMRSNDAIWGASAVNIFNFTFMQEYIAAILGLQVGSYYHSVANLHVYRRHLSLINTLANDTDYIEDTSYIDYTLPTDWNSFLIEIDKLCEAESLLRNGRKSSYENSEYSFFEEWYQVFLAHKTKDVTKIQNPYLKKALSMKLSNN